MWNIQNFLAEVDKFYDAVPYTEIKFDVMF